MIHGDSGHRYEGDTYTLDADSQTVTVVFQDLFRIAEGSNVAAVEPGAAASNTRTGPEATAGAVRLGDLDDSAALTAGPDLEWLDLDDDSGLVTFEFDSELDDREADGIDPNAFVLITESGNISQGEAFVDLDDDHVTILFPRTITEAVEAASVDHGTVFTFNGSPNPAATIDN